MHVLYNVIKYLILNYLPKPVLHALKKAHYARKLSTFSFESEPDIRMVARLVSAGDHVVDIGANIGLYTRALSVLAGRQGLVYSIEPVPDTYDILCSNIRALELENVRPMNNAVSDACGMVSMEIPRHQEHAENFYRAHITEEGDAAGAKVRIMAKSLDAMLGGAAGRITFVKCDVEGHELRCIRGAREFLSSSDASWLMEVTGDPDEAGSNAHELFQEMSLHGYRAWWFDGHTLNERKEGDESTNYFFLKPRHEADLMRKDPSLFRRRVENGRSRA